MEVKRTKTDSGYIHYVVDGSKYITIRAPYETGSKSSLWIIEIPDINIPSVYNNYSTKSIYFLRTLDEVKEVLSRFATEEEFLGAYYRRCLEKRYDYLAEI